MKPKILLLLFALMLAGGVSAQRFNQADARKEFLNQATTPPMGWNSWNKFGCDVSEELLKGIADALVSSGMRDAGYRYVVIDDCWQVGRDAEGNIIVDSVRFPNGMAALADYIHSLGLKFGIYSCAGSKTCQGRPGGRGYQFQDARQYAAWGVDYLKYDWCYNEGQNAKAAYKTMSDALIECGRPIVFSICEWGANQPWTWGDGIGHLWRTTGDIRDRFDGKFSSGSLSAMEILDKTADLSKYAGPGHWNDPDMLEVGNGGMTDTEYRTHFSMWCMMAAPLMAGNDLRVMDRATREILNNAEVIAVDQDQLGKAGYRRIDYGDREVWCKTLSDDNVAVCFLNRGETEWALDYDWNTISLAGKNVGKSQFSVRDLWEHKDKGTTDKKFKAVIPSHGVVMLRLSPVK